MLRITGYSNGCIPVWHEVADHSMIAHEHIRRWLYIVHPEIEAVCFGRCYYTRSGVLLAAIYR